MDASSQFVTLLQSCITPVALISGVGLLLLTITNRLGRTIDRTRALVGELDKSDVKRRQEKVNEIRILYQRSGYLRNSVASLVSDVHLRERRFLVPRTLRILALVPGGRFLRYAVR